MFGFALNTIEFQITDDDELTILSGEPNERVGYERAHGIKHVRIALTVGDDQEVFLGHGSKLGICRIAGKRG